jgi:signal peptidase I
LKSASNVDDALLPLPKHVPFTAKQPAVILNPLAAVVEPSFYTGDYIFTSKITYKFREPNRGDVVVFHSPKNADIEFIKRIIGLPGDKIVIRNSEVYVNDTLIDEPYIAAKTPLWDGGYIKEDEPLIVPSGQIFVMGDNRPRSSDSREFGPVPISSIIGQVFFRYFPSDKMGIVGNPFPKNMQNRTGAMLPLRGDLLAAS